MNPTDKPRKKQIINKLARQLAKAWAANREDYSFLRDDAITVLEQAYEAGKKARRP